MDRYTTRGFRRFSFQNYNLKKYHFRLVAEVLILSIIGVLVIGSAADGYAAKQIFGLFIGIGAMIIVSMMDYNALLAYEWPLYILANLLLLTVLFFGVTVNGAKRWFSLGPLGSLQPSEICKVLLILVLTKLICDHREDISQIKTLAMLGIIYIIPVFLIFEEPNLSTTLVYLFLFCVMIFIGGLDYKFILKVLVCIVPLGALLIWYVQQPFQVLLHGYQLERVMAYLNPSEFMLTTYNQQYNSVMAIGSGMFLGKGLNNNTFTSVKGGDFISEPQTDFIFAVVGEELGFVGSCVVILLLLAIVIECLMIAKNASNLAGRLIAVGVATVIAFQTFVNIGVATAMLPNTGLPLPFVSYGLSALLTNMIGIGLVLNINLQKNRR